VCVCVCVIYRFYLYIYCIFIHVSGVVWTRLITERVSGEDNAIGRVRPFVFTLAFEPADV